MLLVFLLIGFLFLFISLPSLEAKKKSIICYYDPTPPTIDGWIYKVEWDGAAPPSMLSFYGEDDDCDAIEKTDEDHMSARYLWDLDYLYILIIVEPIPTEIDDDVMGFFFHTNDSAPFVEMGIDQHSPININKGNDAKLFYIYNNHTIDGFTTGVGLNTTDDIAGAGSENSYGKCSIDNSGLISRLIIEMQFALNITDINGCDVTVAENTHLNLTIFYDQGPSGCFYTEYSIEDEEFEYIELLLSESTRPLGYSWIFVPLILPGITSLILLIRRRIKS